MITRRDLLVALIAVAGTAAAFALAGQAPVMGSAVFDPNEELIIVMQGTVETLSNGEWKRVGPGSVIFNASNQLHGLRNVGAGEAVYHVINWESAATPEASNSEPRR